MNAREHQHTAVTITDPLAIRALAHKVRLDVIEELFAADASHTATALAHRFGLTPSAMSYHLRALEKWGYVVRAETGPDGRERHWKAAGDTLNVGGLAAASDLVSSALIDVTLNAAREKVVAALRQVDASADGGKPTLVVSTSQLLLTEAEGKELAAELEALVKRYGALHRAAPPQGLQRMHLTTVLTPDADPAAGAP
ncbi:ArsR/SmtB family transcription factor [Arthrobacter sp. 35W]|uniref:ArsR/SmtB family transcription factor n=1 Tax=Arthrobacter sp. 35W TaxID=1132441 RepID=UPI00040ADD44|nr:winged helix-turn-helix domain-containing protein [Arthrobacter sp. 35W]